MTAHPNGAFILSFSSSHLVERDDRLLVDPGDVEGVPGLPLQDGVFQLGVLPEVGVGGGDAAYLGSGDGQLGNGEGPHAWWRERGRGGAFIISCPTALHLRVQRLILASDLLPSFASFTQTLFTIFPSDKAEHLIQRNGEDKAEITEEKGSAQHCGIIKSLEKYSQRAYCRRSKLNEVRGRRQSRRGDKEKAKPVAGSS